MQDDDDREGWTAEEIAEVEALDREAAERVAASLESTRVLMAALATWEPRELLDLYAHAAGAPEGEEPEDHDEMVAWEQNTEDLDAAADLITGVIQRRKASA